MVFRSKIIFGIALAAAVFAGANGWGEGPKTSPNAPKVLLYPAIDTFPAIVDARHANKEAVDLFNRFFAQRAGTTSTRPWNSYLAISRCTPMRRWAGN